MAIDFTEYDRITDTLMYLSDNISLGFTVGFSRKSKTGDRVFYHYETQYGSDKYGSALRSIKRQLSYAFTIDCKDDFMSGMMFKPQDIELLVRIIDQKVFPWFFGNEKQIAFKTKEGKYILKQFEPVSYVQQNGRWISFQPAIYVDPISELESMGIRTELYSQYSWILPMDKFMGFYNIIARSDMYNIACTLCNYVKMQPYGVNVYSNKGLGATPNGNNNNVDDAWKDTKEKFAKNSFLNDSGSKRKGE